MSDRPSGCQGWPPGRVIGIAAGGLTVRCSLRTFPAASEEFPANPLTTGHSLHVFPMRGCWQVWLNTQPSDFNGLRVAMGRTYEDAVNAALQVFARASDTLLSGSERPL